MRVKTNKFKVGDIVKITGTKGSCNSEKSCQECYGKTAILKIWDIDPTKYIHRNPHIMACDLLYGGNENLCGSCNFMEEDLSLTHIDWKKYLEVKNEKI